LTSKVRGEVEKEDNILIIKRIFVTYYLKIADDQRETAERVHRFHAKFCPVARSIQGCIEIETDLKTESL
jgi:organic hydroperoxide reductase OsmC/OhrA